MRDRIFTFFIWLFSMFVTAAFLWIIIDLLIRGAPSLSIEFFTSEPIRSGREGGIYPIIISTLLILMVSIVVTLPLGLASAIWLAEFIQKESQWAANSRLLLDVLAGVPSIVYGLFGYAFFSIFLNLGFSILSGGLTLACMMLPILIRTATQGLMAVSDDWRQASAALGMSKFSVLWHVLLPYAAPAITTGILLAIGRATAETAALIFTSGYVDRMPESLHDSGRALAVHIYDLSMNVMGGDKAAYGSALVLIIFIITINLLTITASNYWSAKKVKRY
jgi:phosphate transport system permease protein